MCIDFSTLCREIDTPSQSSTTFSKELLLAKDLTIPQRLEYLLKKRGVSQNALARVAKISPQTVANTLRHGRVPQSKTTLKWAKVLGVPGNVFTAKNLTDDALNKIIASSGSWKFAEGTAAPARKAVAKKPAARKAVAKKTAKKPVAKKAAAKKIAKKPVARKAVAKKVAKKPIAKKTVAKKPVARKAVAKKAVAKKIAKKPVARKAVAKKVTKKTVAKKAVAKKVTRKPVAKKTMAKKPVARKTVAKKPIARKAVAKKVAARKPAARKTTSRTTIRKSAARGPVRGGAKSGYSLDGIDWNLMVTRLQKLASSRTETVQLGAISALLQLRK